jgi:hypothetical protein
MQKSKSGEGPVAPAPGPPPDWNDRVRLNGEREDNVGKARMLALSLRQPGR